MQRPCGRSNWPGTLTPSSPLKHMAAYPPFPLPPENSGRSFLKLQAFCLGLGPPASREEDPEGQPAPLPPTVLGAQQGPAPWLPHSLWAVGQDPHGCQSSRGSPRFPQSRRECRPLPQAPNLAKGGS